MRYTADCCHHGYAAEKRLSQGMFLTCGRDKDELDQTESGYRAGKFAASG
ncbi:hypothetical protein KL86SPO_40355 [uncultured Sporomusa sp.]|uniref:Uncharacterized protein n=1 Tax=uncultured Sporomusa sp. TaxID=307249 RepID=A0A212LWL3_9FIRM|nr:hypothetical protein KL86SPO_40355 [uncultured Sporomusa sp.]